MQLSARRSDMLVHPETDVHALPCRGIEALPMRFRRMWVGLGCVVGLLASGACGGGPDASASTVQFRIPSGANFGEVVDTLQARGVVRRPGLFGLYARLRGADAEVRAGSYELREGERWSDVIATLTEGRVLTVPVTFPEGWRLAQMGPKIAAFSGVPGDSVDALLFADSAHLPWGVPGPGLEGYLFPETYHVTPEAEPLVLIRAMVDQYRSFWTESRRARLDSLQMTEREVVTLASIVQAEARVADEMPRIAGVYHNRLQAGWLLQADPTVLYALGGPRPRLLFAAIDSVAGSPYNTYTQPGLPPGPIGAPGASALIAALYPEAHEFMFFVATPDGRHVFTRSLREHNRAVADARRARDSVSSSPNEGGR